MTILNDGQDRNIVYNLYRNIKISGVKSTFKKSVAKVLLKKV